MPEDVWSQRSIEAFNSLRRGTLVCVSFLMVELVGGYLANSLAIIADAAHVMSDIASFALAMYAIWGSAAPGTRKHSFGKGRVQILCALISVLSIWVITLFIVQEAVTRFMNPAHVVNAKVMMITGAFGVCSNVVLTQMLGGFHTHGLPSFGEKLLDHDHSHGCGGHHHDHDHDHHGHLHESIPDVKAAVSEISVADLIPFVGAKHQVGGSGYRAMEDGEVNKVTDLSSDINVRAAYLHALGDILQNIGIILAGIAIWLFPTATWIDPAVTLLFAVLVFLSTLELLQQIWGILMAKTPDSVDIMKVEADLLAVPGVQSIHDLHCWEQYAGTTHFTCHIVSQDTHGGAEERETMQRAISEVLQRKHSLLHTTVQVDHIHGLEACNTVDHKMCHGCEITQDPNDDCNC